MHEAVPEQRSDERIVVYERVITQAKTSTDMNNVILLLAIPLMCGKVPAGAKCSWATVPAAASAR